MSKKIFFEDEARNRILEGAGTLYRAVKTTMSPLGRNVVIKRPYGHTITHDGVTVAENIELDNIELAVGADIIKEAAGKLNNEVGDGTTSVTVLTYNLMEQANALIRSGMNAMDVRNELNKIKEKFIRELENHVVKLDDSKLIDVATISAGNPELGHLIGILALQVGKDGSIIVERGKSYKDEVELTSGFTFDRSYISPYFITDQKRQSAVLENPTVILTDKKLRTFKEVDDLIQKTGEPKGIFLVCDELTGEALAALVQTSTRGVLPIVAVQAPSFGDSRREIMADLAAYLGAEVFDDVNEGKVATVNKVVVTRDKTTILEGKGDITERIENLKGLEKTIDSDFEKKQLGERIANLTGAVGKIKVGGSSETEADEKKYRVDDAVAAVKAAQRGGVVAGAGTTLITLAESIQQGFDADRRVIDMVTNAMCMPFKTILENGNVKNIDEALKVAKTNHGFGFNVKNATPSPIDLVQVGVIDPAEVTKQVIEAAFSIAMTAITVDVLVVDVPDEV